MRVMFPLRPKLFKLSQNAYLRRSPHPSSLQRTIKYASCRLTNSLAWQDVAPHSSQRHSQDCLPDRQVKGLRAPCIQAFLISLSKNEFFNRLFILDLGRILQASP
jgi:hypothetical protein